MPLYSIRNSEFHISTSIAGLCRIKRRRHDESVDTRVAGYLDSDEYVPTTYKHLKSGDCHYWKIYVLLRDSAISIAFLLVCSPHHTVKQRARRRDIVLWDGGGVQKRPQLSSPRFPVLINWSIPVHLL